ncbi:hypothetical protein BJX61DRAFT_534794 [Aspergillus egyptiacus]|nr:hypothetical protein BJX61DRAFT_534794 [Aspergillus egyptiacus]
MAPSQSHLPGGSELPTCRWRGMPSHGVICSPGCDDGEVEVGTLAKFCDFSHQSACCTTTKSTEPYGHCKWVGASPLCASLGKHASCPSDYPTFLFSSSAGAGGEQICSQGSKSFCCKGEFVKRSVLSVESFDRLNTLTARTVVSLLSMTVNLWNGRGPAKEFGRSYLAQEMNEMVFGAEEEANAFGYVSDMNAFPEIGHDGTLRLRAAEDDLCELLGGGAAKAKRALQSSNWQALEERHINVLGGLGNFVLIGEPAIEDILRGILDGFLALHYARWEHYGNVRNGRQGPAAGPFLELAYGIGNRIGERGSNAGLYQDDPSDRWVVFHLHTLSDEHAFIPDPNQADNPFMGVTHITVHHGQRLQTDTERDRERTDRRVYNRDSERHADGTYAGNTRAPTHSGATAARDGGRATSRTSPPRATIRTRRCCRLGGVACTRRAIWGGRGIRCCTTITGIGCRIRRGIRGMGGGGG